MEIKHRIVQGVYAPGSAALGVQARPRSTLEPHSGARGLTRLVEEGYVERVRWPRLLRWLASPWRVIRDVFEVRRLLEGAAAARAAELADRRGHRASSAVSCSSSTLLGDTRELQARPTEANNQFHVALALASRNGIFVDLIRHCLDQVTRLIALGLDFEPLQDKASLEHRAVVDAIEKRDPEGARRAIERHLDGSARRITEALLKGEVSAVTV